MQRSQFDVYADSYLGVPGQDLYVDRQTTTYMLSVNPYKKGNKT